MKRLPTEKELGEILAAFESLPNVTCVDVVPVQMVEVTTTIRSMEGPFSGCKGIYDMEQEIMKRFPDVSFDFRVEHPGETE